jgi:hypothetical protein
MLKVLYSPYIHSFILKNSFINRGHHKLCISCVVPLCLVASYSVLTSCAGLFAVTDKYYLLYLKWLSAQNLTHAEM